MRIITWNVNGIRSVLTKEKDGTKHSKPVENNVISALLQEQAPDVLCLQEIKCGFDINVGAMFKLNELGYQAVYTNCSTVKKGYSGVCVISKSKPLHVFQGFSDFNNDHMFNNEGRMLTMEYDNCYVVNVYTPNSKHDLSRLDFRVNEWDVQFRNFIEHLSKTKHVIVSGDLNVAPQEIDLSNPKANHNSHGFTLQERQSFHTLLQSAQLVDAFRHLNPRTAKYSWFSPFAKSRERNKGWRIDHVLVSRKLASNLESSEILSDYFGSDHVPCLLDVSI
jgi:exodeoxyribonuclease-3